MYSSVPNRRACMFISGKVCLLSSIDVKRQTLPEINVHARLFGTLEYLRFRYHSKILCKLGMKPRMQIAFMYWLYRGP